MQTTPSQDQLNRIENIVNRLTQLVERLIEKVEQDDSIFRRLVTSERFQRENQEDLELLKKYPSQFSDLYEAYQNQKPRRRVGHEAVSARRRALDKDPHTTPRHVEHPAAGEAHRRRLGAVRADQVDHARGIPAMIYRVLGNSRRIEKDFLKIINSFSQDDQNTTFDYGPRHPSAIVRPGR